MIKMTEKDTWLGWYYGMLFMNCKCMLLGYLNIVIL